MSVADYFMITGTIYISHELPPAFRTVFGAVSVLVGVAIQVVERQ